MYVFVLIVSRIVPTLFFASACLVAGRFAHDLLARSSRPLARFAFATILVLCGVATFPYLVRLRHLVGAQVAFGDDRWKETDAYMQRFEEFGGRATGLFARDWAVALMNGGAFAEAERVLLAGFDPRAGRVAALPDSILLLGTSRYHLGRPDQAIRALRALEGMEGVQHCLRLYFIGRSFDRLGRREEAAAEYAGALKIEPRFFPALYHLARVEAASGRREDAVAHTAAFMRLDPRQAPVVGPLLEALRRGQTPPDREFKIVQN